MAGVASEESGLGSSTEGISSVAQCRSGEALAEWRSSDQVENGTSSTSPPYWDTDDDDSGGLKPSELYGKYTWKIEKFSQINKRELRSNAFEVGGYKWYILIYPQGCDVCNHLSLFLCVANHDKLLPGWSHFAQFTIAVVNKDPKKSKYSDTLHRFWKKEHDWGWKKFMELSKVFDGFIDSDTLIIKAQVQVIREKADRPFRCLDCQYRRELVRVYLSSVEQTCRRFVEERSGKLGGLIEDKARWSSFCAFWLGIDQNSRRRMSREKSDVVLKVVVKHFFIEKEVTSTLVMDSLYSGLKALEGQSKSKKGRGKLLEFEGMHAPIVRADKDMFVLVDDVLMLLERAASEPLPPKDEKGPQNRTKDGNSGDDFNKDSIERDERRLTELGRRTVEIFVLNHIFSNKIEVAYQEAVALKRQEELIREEEAAAWLAEIEHKAKRGTPEKEKKSKKKQAKQKRNNRKAKDKEREEKASAALNKHQEESSGVEKVDLIEDEVQPVDEKPDVMEDVSDISDSMDGIAEALPPDSEDRDVNPVNSDTDVSEVHPATETSSSGVSGLSSIANGVAERKGPCLMDDSSSTCSTDSVPSVVANGPYKGNSSTNHQNKKSSNRGKNQRSKVTSDTTSWGNGMENQPSGPTLDTGDHNDVSESSRGGESETEATVTLLQDQIKLRVPNVLKKDETLQQKKQSIKVAVDVEQQPLKEKTLAVSSSPQRSQFKSDYRSVAALDSDPVRKASLNIPQETDQVASPSAAIPHVSKSGTHKATSPRPPEKSAAQQVPVMSRPSSAPLFPGPRPIAPVVSMVQTAPLLARSVSAVGRLGLDPTPATFGYLPQSYRNAIIGNSVGPSLAGFAHQSSSSSAVNPSLVYSQPMFLPQNTERIDTSPVQSSFSFGMSTRDVLQNGPQWMESSQRGSSSTLHGDPSIIHDIQNLDLYSPLQTGLRGSFTAETSGRQTHGGVLGDDDFPHLDIINDLLDDEYGIGKTQPLMRQYSFPGDVTMSNDNVGSSSSCRFERTQSYHGDRFQRGYSPVNSHHFDSLREYNNIPQASPSLPYMNGQVEGGLMQNHWPIAPGSDLAMLGMRNSEGDSYPPFYNPDYANLACGINGYTLFRPSNGH